MRHHLSTPIQRIAPVPSPVMSAAFCIQVCVSWEAPICYCPQYWVEAMGKTALPRSATLQATPNSSSNVLPRSFTSNGG